VLVLGTMPSASSARCHAPLRHGAMCLFFGTMSSAQATIASFHRADQPSAHAATVRLSNAARHLIAFRNKVAGASLRAASGKACLPWMLGCGVG
jgi:hypothetical protein